jgi:tetratricopeptide (TPR) repeat protein
MSKRMVWVAAVVSSALTLPGRLARAEGSGAAGNAKAEACEDDYQTDDFDSAQKDCQDAIDASPTIIDPYVTLAATDIAQKNWNDAIQLMQKAQKFAVTTEDKLKIERYQGLALYYAGQIDQSIPLLEDVARAHPDAYDVQLCIGQRSLKVGDGTRARVALLAYFQYRPDKVKAADHDVRYLLAAAYLLEGDWQNAQSQVDTGLHEQPDDAGFKLLQAQVFMGEGSYDQAVSVLEPLLPTTTGPSHAKIALKLATCYAQIPGRSDDAVAMARQYIDAFPKDETGYVLLGDVYVATADPQDALTAYESAQSYAPNDTALLLKIGDTHLALGHASDAQSTLQQAQKSSPDDPHVLSRLGRADIALGDFKGAITTLEHLVAVKPSRISDAEDLLARAYLGAGRNSDAQTAYQAAWDKSKSGDEIAGYGLVFLYNSKAIDDAKAGKFDDAQAQIAKALVIDPDRLETNRNQAVVALMAGKYDDALPPLAKVLSKVHNDLVANRLEARALLGKGDLDGAAKSYDTAMNQALRAGSPVAIAEVEAEQASLLVTRGGDGDLDRACANLDDAVARRGLDADTMKGLKRARALAYGKRGLLDLAAAKGDLAVKDLGTAISDPTLLQGLEPQELGFALGLANLEGGHAQPAAQAFQAAESGQSTGAPSFLAAPYDTLGTTFFTAYAQYRTGGNDGLAAASATFGKLLGSAKGAEANTLRSLVRSCWEYQAFGFYQGGSDGQALDALHTAGKYLNPGEQDRDLSANEAALDLLLGSGDAQSELAALGPNPPEALVNLGVYWDRQHDPQKAYSYFKQAVQAGAQSPHLGDWVAALNREFDFDGANR